MLARLLVVAMLLTSMNNLLLYKKIINRKHSQEKWKAAISGKRDPKTNMH